MGVGLGKGAAPGAWTAWAAWKAVGTGEVDVDVNLARPEFKARVSLAFIRQPFFVPIHFRTHSFSYPWRRPDIWRSGSADVRMSGRLKIRVPLILNPPLLRSDLIKLNLWSISQKKTLIKSRLSFQSLFRKWVIVYTYIEIIF